MYNININLKKWQLPEFYKILNYMYCANFNELDYICFFNINNLLQKINKLNENSNFSNRENYKISLTPNEAAELVKLIQYSNNLTLITGYYENLLNDITASVHKEFTELIHKKNIYSLNNFEQSNFKKLE
jgi:hypothetical protein